MSTAEKIVIVAGERFRVPADTATEAIRASLTPMFPDVASATVKEGKETIEGVEMPTIEFVKKAGTKGGLTGEEVAALISAAAPARLPWKPGQRAEVHSLQAILNNLVAGHYTFGVLEDRAFNARLETAIQGSNRKPDTATFEGNMLCANIAVLQPAASSADVCGW